MNRRKFMQLCGLVVGGGVLGVGKVAVAQPASTLATDMLTLGMGMDGAIHAIERALDWDICPMMKWGTLYWQGQRYDMRDVVFTRKEAKQ